MSMTLFTPTHSANLEADNDRAACLYALQDVTDAASAGRFVARWRRALEGYLADPPEDIDELDALREEASNHEQEANRLGAWLEDFADQVDHVADDLFGFMIEEEKAEAIAARLQKIIETMRAVVEADPE